MGTYPYDAPVILTDTMFIEYGGETGTSTSFQRQAAYYIAETFVTEFLNTLLIPTIVTGTYVSDIRNLIEREYGQIRKINQVLLRFDNQNYRVLNASYDYYLYNPEQGIISVSPYFSPYARDPGRFEISFEAGFSTGISTRPDMLSGLVIVADIALKDLIDPTANEGVGDIGISEFRSEGYSEVRKGLIRTALGNSARAQRAAQLLRKYRSNRLVRIR